jgi:hypothetical protein
MEALSSMLTIPDLITTLEELIEMIKSDLIYASSLREKLAGMTPSSLIGGLLPCIH